MMCAGTGRSSGEDLAALRDVSLKLCGVLIINVLALIYTELANLSALVSAILVVSLVSQGYLPPFFKS